MRYKFLMTNALWSYLDSIRIEHETSKGTALYMITLVRYRDAPLSRLVGLKGRRMHPVLFFDGTGQRSSSRRPCGHVDTVMTSS